MMYQSLEHFSLRKINFVKTRTTILKAVTTLLKEQDFSDITVDEICQRAQISRGTFFNYFPTKDHIFHYYLRIFTIKIALRIKNWSPDMTFQKKIEEIYTWFNEEKQYTKFLDYYINFLLNVGEEANEIKLIAPEFVYFFNGITEQEYSYYNALTINKIFEQMVQEAKEKKQITTEQMPKDLAALCMGVVTATYVSNAISKDKNCLQFFYKALL